ncbi:unnamed protein product [Hydatigera taeniaeformis]|uniref:Secreted protein n=1 Tax=Hydatigena taeniaeformis TaxID=6205 RepID=A0A0R3WU40_HYDTA|nr:unnamed protein product [Hydatigera taeniaeformis]
MRFATSDWLAMKETRLTATTVVPTCNRGAIMPHNSTTHPSKAWEHVQQYAHIAAGFWLHLPHPFVALSRHPFAVAAFCTTKCLFVRSLAKLGDVEPVIYPQRLQCGKLWGDCCQMRGLELRRLCHYKISQKLDAISATSHAAFQHGLFVRLAAFCGKLNHVLVLTSPFCCVSGGREGGEESELSFCRTNYDCKAARGTAKWSTTDGGCLVSFK